MLALASVLRLVGAGLTTNSTAALAAHEDSRQRLIRHHDGDDGRSGDGALTS
jgi:hypothetical protein